MKFSGRAALSAGLLLGSLAFASLASASERLPLRAVGTKIVDSAGKTVTLRGVNVASLEWSSDGEGHVLETIRVAARDWKVNVVRVPLAQDRWFGAGPEQKDIGFAYRALVQQVVDTAVKEGIYVILDLHWNDAEFWGQSIGQHVMPDRNSVTFWKDLARTYKNHPSVIFDLYNEPHDVSWEVWRNGGSVTERGPRAGTSTTYKAVGMQELLDVVRKTGAKNLVMAGGIDWAYDLKGVVEGHRLNDPTGNGVLYVCHAYPFKGDTVAQWIAKMDAYTAHVPVIVSEFGSDPGKNREGLTGQEWVEKVVATLMKRKWHFTAWDLHPAAGPTLISNWKYTPTKHFGVIVKEALAKKK